MATRTHLTSSLARRPHTAARCSYSRHCQSVDLCAQTPCGRQRKLAIAQMGVHLVFFLHITTGPDNTNNVLALAFGILIVFVVVAGSLWIMRDMNANMMPL